MANATKTTTTTGGLGKESQAVRNETKGAPTADELRANNLSTGGGEPIEKGHKWTSEKRVLQPRDPSTGHFEYNSSANFSLKYKSRGKGVPLFMRGWKIDYVKKGDVMTGPNGKRYWVPVDMTKDEFIDNMKYYIEGKDGVGHYMGLDSGAFKAKSGAPSKKEKAAIAQGGIQVAGNHDISKAGPSIQAKLAKAAQDYQAATAHKPPLMGKPIYANQSNISASKQAANQAYNAQQGSAQGGGSQPTSSPSQPTAPKKQVSYFDSENKFTDEGRKNIRSGYTSDANVKSTVDNLAKQFGATSDEIMTLIENGDI
jgi:hypothetical protein